MPEEKKIAVITSRLRKLGGYILSHRLLFGLLMLTSMAQGLLFGFDNLSIALTLSSVVCLVVLIVPSLFSYPILEEIEHEFERRGEPYNDQNRISHRLQRYTGKVVFWAFIIVIICNYSRSFLG